MAACSTSEVSGSSAATPSLPVFEGDKTVFTNELKTYLESVQAIARDALTNDDKRSCFQTFKELRDHVAKAQTEIGHDAGLMRIQGTANRAMQWLRTGYTTNSHWLNLTMRQSHLEDVKPDIEVTPHFKYELSKLDEALEKVKLMPRGIEKVRALQHIHETICASQAENTPELLQKLYVFSEEHLMLNEKIMALKQINYRDKDSGQSQDLSSLLDATGKGYAEYFIANVKEVEMLVNYLTVVLRDRATLSSCVSPITLMEEWPKEIGDLDGRQRTTWTATLMKFSQSESANDPYSDLVISYLSNIIDPTGELRYEHLRRSTKGQEFVNKIAGIADTMQQFGFDHRPLLNNVAIRHRAPSTNPKLKFGYLIEKMKTKPLTQTELKHVVLGLKSAIASDWRTFDIDAFLENPKKFKDLVEHRIEIANPIRDFFINVLKSGTTAKHQKVFLRNVLLVNKQLVIQGELSVSFTLFNAGIDNTRRSCKDAWDQLSSDGRKANESLTRLFEVSSNFKNLRAFMRQLNAKHAIRIPYFAIDQRDIVQFKEQLGQMPDNTIEKLFREHKDTMESLIGQFAPAGEKNLENWAKENMVRNMSVILTALKRLSIDSDEKSAITAELKELLSSLRDLQLTIEQRNRELNRQFIALDLWYQNYPTDESVDTFYRSFINKIPTE